MIFDCDVDGWPAEGLDCGSAASAGDSDVVGCADAVCVLGILLEIDLAVHDGDGLELADFAKGVSELGEITKVAAGVDGVGCDFVDGCAPAHDRGHGGVKDVFVSEVSQVNAASHYAPTPTLFLDC